MSQSDLSALQAEYDELRSRGLSLDLTRGKPAPEQLDLAERLLALPGEGDHAEGGTDVRNYGGGSGLPELRAIFGELLGVPTENIVAQDNASLAIMYDLISFAYCFGTNDSARPWSQEGEIKWLCPVPGYDRHFSVTNAFGFEMIPIELGEDGPDIDAIERLVAEDPAIKGMWAVPLYSNPTGVSYSEAVTKRLAEMPTAADDFRIVWDNAYALHTLTPDFPESIDVLSLATEAGHPNRFWQVASTSKISHAGSGVAFLTSSTENLDWYLGHTGIRTIGPNKVNQLAHLRFFGDAEGVREHMGKHREIIAPKFEAALEALEGRLGGAGIASWTHPEGGYFIDLEVPEGKATEVVRLAKELGVALTPAGAAFPHGDDPRDAHIRLAPTMPSLDDVRTAIDLVGLCTLIAAAS